MARKRNDNTFGRKVFARNKRKYFLIVCEGKKTEPNYFNSFRITKNVIKLEIEGSGANTDSLVEAAFELKQKRERVNGQRFDEVWCVFDRDSFTAHNFNRALRLAENNGFKVAYSNEAFELWYILHFEFLDAGINREQYFEKLGRYLGRPYEKNSNKIYEEIFERQNVAIKNAEKLLQRYDPPNPEQDKPSTTVHLLVEELNKYLI